MRRPSFAPACEPLDARLLLSGAAILAGPPPSPHAEYGSVDHGSPEYREFLDSSASDYELETGAFYERDRQFPGAPPYDAAAGPGGQLRMLIQDIMAAYRAYRRGAD